MWTSSETPVSHIFWRRQVLYVRMYVCTYLSIYLYTVLYMYEWKYKCMYMYCFVCACINVHYIGLARSKSSFQSFGTRPSRMHAEAGGFDHMSERARGQFLVRKELHDQFQIDTPPRPTHSLLWCQISGEIILMRWNLCACMYVCMYVVR